MAEDAGPARAAQPVQDPRGQAARIPLRRRLLRPGHVVSARADDHDRPQGPRAQRQPGRRLRADRVAALVRQADLRAPVRLRTALRPAAAELLPAHLGGGGAYRSSPGVGNWIATGQVWTFNLFGLTTFTVVEGFALFFLMALGLAFTDVLTDAMMVESGRPLRLTGAFQSAQWACITLASVLVGELGGQLAETRSLRTAFLLAACFPLMSLSMGLTFVRETPARASRAAFLETWKAIRATLGGREIWLVAGFIFFFWFSPSLGPAFLYYQTDTLGFSQQFIGRLAALGSVAGVVGAVLYAPLSRRVSLKSLMHISIALGTLSTLSYLFYRGAASAVIITVVFGAIGMIFNLGFLDLAARSCPPHVEATFFAALMSV